MQYLSIEQIETNIIFLTEFIDTKIADSNIATISDHLNELISIQGLSANTQASAKFHNMMSKRNPYLSALYEYASRLSTGLSNKISALQTSLRVEAQFRLK